MTHTIINRLMSPRLFLPDPVKKIPSGLTVRLRSWRSHEYRIQVDHVRYGNTEWKRGHYPHTTFHELLTVDSINSSPANAL